MDNKIRLQPLVDLNNGSIYGYEALCSRNFCDANACGQFPSAERILRAITSDCKDIRNFQLFINMTIDDAGNKNFGKLFLNALEELGVDGEQVVLEVNESTPPEMLAQAKQSLSLLRMHNVKIALDDFGTQCSTLELMSEIPLDIIKIDKKFVQNAPYSKKNRSLLKFCVDVSHNIGCKVVAEGIETEDQFECVKEFNVDIGQGFFFSITSLERQKVDPFINLSDFITYTSLNDSKLFLVTKGDVLRNFGLLQYPRFVAIKKPSARIEKFKKIA